MPREVVESPSLEVLKIPLDQCQSQAPLSHCGLSHQNKTQPEPMDTGKGRSERNRRDFCSQKK
ncbi:hypothetical protein QYF61_009871 [Mycteria americana]|uniref:Uncharacterized protein n=1 Tax=Mycteria americana TaxID=33587 RepID=A0AAN7NDR4_MYCAM|nr:hypothetical protein QYF61_009871 [Mycteria americana]